MAIPTDFKGYTPSAGTTKSFKILGSATVGIWANDVDGSLSATCGAIPVGPNLVLFFSQAYTDAQIVPLVKDWLARMGAYHDGAGGQPVEVSKQVAVSAQTTS